MQPISYKLFMHTTYNLQLQYYNYNYNYNRIEAAACALCCAGQQRRCDA